MVNAGRDFLVPPHRRKPEALGAGKGSTSRAPPIQPFFQEHAAFRGPYFLDGDLTRSDPALHVLPRRFGPVSRKPTFWPLAGGFLNAAAFFAGNCYGHTGPRRGAFRPLDSR
jgi:hypothetical protein